MILLFILSTTSVENAYFEINWSNKTQVRLHKKKEIVKKQKEDCQRRDFKPDNLEVEERQLGRATTMLYKI